MKEDGSAMNEPEVSLERKERKGEGEKASLPLDKRFVTFLRVLLCCVPEVTTRDSSSYSVVVLAARKNVVLVAMES